MYTKHAFMKAADPPVSNYANCELSIITTLQECSPHPAGLETAQKLPEPP